jgi:3-isopropylmalate dehydrogenase
MKIAHEDRILPGDGIGPRSSPRRSRCCDALGRRLRDRDRAGRRRRLRRARPPAARATLALAQAADAVLFGAVGDWKYDKLERALRPEQAILGLRKQLGLFANLRPAICTRSSPHASTLKPEVVAGLDILIIRELTGDIYFGQPRGRRTRPTAHSPAPRAFDTMRYSGPEIERIAHVSPSRRRASAARR